MSFPIVILVESEGDTDALNLPKVKTTVIEIRHVMDYATEANLEIFRRKYRRDCEELDNEITVDGFIQYLNESGIPAIKLKSHGNIVLD